MTLRAEQIAATIEGSVRSGDRAADLGSDDRRESGASAAEKEAGARHRVDRVDIIGRAPGFAGSLPHS